MAVDRKEWRAALLRIAQTKDGKLLFAGLQEDRIKAFETLKVSEGLYLARCQGGFNLLQTLFNHNDIDNPDPR